MTRDEILAMPAGPELDALVAERVMGLCPHRAWRNTGPAREPSTDRGRAAWALLGPYGDRVECLECEEVRVLAMGQLAVIVEDPAPYSADISAAWEVMEKLKERAIDATLAWQGASTACGEGWWFGVIDATGDYCGLDGLGEAAPTAPLAICRAALLVFFANPQANLPSQSETENG